MSDGSEFTSGLDQLRLIRIAAQREFDGTSDFLWKAPSFIEEQVKIELQKLQAYFPLTGDTNRDEFVIRMRKARWSLEATNLFGLFPHMLYSGNLSALLSLLETYLFRLCVILESVSGRELTSIHSSGIDRLFKYLNLVSPDLSISLDVNSLAYHQQIRAALIIRNALVHASGILKMARNASSIEGIIKNHLYLHRKDRRKEIISDSRYTVRLIPGNYGDRIVVGYLFVWRYNIYCRDFFTTLCDRLTYELSTKKLK